MHAAHPLAARLYANRTDLLDEELITVPVSVGRLDVYARFLVPGRCKPRVHRTAEATDLMLQLVAAGRGVSVLPDWLVHEEGANLPVRTVRLDADGITKRINLGVRRGEDGVDFIAGFLGLAQANGSLKKHRDR